MAGLWKIQALNDLFSHSSLFYNSTSYPIIHQIRFGNWLSTTLRFQTELTFWVCEVCKDCWRKISRLIFIRIEVLGHSRVWKVLYLPNGFPISRIFSLATEPNHSVLRCLWHRWFFDGFFQWLWHVIWQLGGIVGLRQPTENLEYIRLHNFLAFYTFRNLLGLSWNCI